MLSLLAKLRVLAPGLSDGDAAEALAASMPERELAAVRRRVTAYLAFGVSTLAALAGNSALPAVDAIQSGHSSRRLWDDEQRVRLAAVYAAVNAVLELLGRVKMRELQANFIGKRDDVAPLVSVPSHVPFMDPERAAAWFLTLYPNLALDRGFANRHKRLAAALTLLTDAALLVCIKNLVRESPADVLARLNPAAYAANVFDSSITEQFNEGTDREYREPDMQVLFPVWFYRGIIDKRTGKDHRPRINRYYPASVPFREVRGPRWQWCRCSPHPVDLVKWAALKRKGARVETEWKPVPA